MTIREQYRKLRESQEAEFDKIPSYKEYTKAQEKRKEHIERVTKKHKEEIEKLKQDAEARLRAIDSEITVKRYPSLSSGGAFDKQSAEMSFLAATILASNARTYPVEDLKTAIALKRFDFASSLVQQMERNVPADQSLKGEFTNEARKLEQVLGVDILKAEAADIALVKTQFIPSLTTGVNQRAYSSSGSVAFVESVPGVISTMRAS